jgi:hypothetical protein
MGGSEADIEPKVSITGMRRVIAQAKSNPQANGQFFNYDGAELTW